MGACAYGAEPTAAARDTQVWIDRLALALDWLNVVSNYTPLALASVAASLTSVDGICAENPDPPEAITVEDVLAQTAAFPTAGAIGSNVVIEKIYRALRYQQFLQYCVCKPPPPPPTSSCPYSNSTIALAAFGTSAPVPYTIDQGVYDSWPVAIAGSTVNWMFGRDVSWTGGAPGTQEVFVQHQHADGSWTDFIDLAHGPVAGGTCALNGLFLQPPKIQQTGHVRLFSRAGFPITITGLSLCFCGVAVTPPPLTPQPPLTGLPLPPALACSTDDLCRMITELNHRLTLVSTEVSDIKAATTGTDVLTVLESHPIVGEGELVAALGTRVVSIELDVLGPEAFTSALGRPRGLMRVGSVRWGDGTGYSPRRFIDGDRFDDPRPMGALSLSYQLLAGTSGTLRFLG